jgi:predicted ABC-type transport system involved in lysophospholipase L1 biosynthesis ATPase subunit
MNTAPVLEVREVTKHYQMGTELVRALSGVSLTIHKGEYVAIMGASGSGKSTLLNILGCLDSPTSGQYFLGGEDVSRLSESVLAIVRGKRIGFIFQTFELLPRATALKNVELPLLYSRAPNRRQRVLDALKRVGLADRMGHRPNELSGGQRQRVAIVPGHPARRRANRQPRQQNGPGNPGTVRPAQRGRPDHCDRDARFLHRRTLQTDCSYFRRAYRCGPARSKRAPFETRLRG